MFNTHSCLMECCALCSCHSTTFDCQLAFQCVSQFELKRANLLEGKFFIFLHHLIDLFASNYFFVSMFVIKAMFSIFRLYVFKFNIELL